MKNRIKKIFGLINDDLDVIIIKNSISPYIDPSFFYVTGFDSGFFENCIALLYPDGSSEILSTELEREISKGPNTIVFHNNSDRDNVLKKRIKKKKIGVNFKNITHSDYLLIRSITGQKIYDVASSLKKARLLKDKLEIKYISKACEISSEIANKIPFMLKENIREKDIAAEISHHIFKKNASLAFRPIAAFGKHSSQPHYSYGTKKISRGLALFDFGAKYKRYCSDITRTFYYGKIPNKVKKLYDTVLGAQERALSIMKPGVKGSTVHKEVESFISKNGYGKLIHSTGHSIGLSVHDGDVLHTRSNIILEEGMVFTVEPGIYCPDMGGVRIEDDVLICEDGLEVLTQAKKSIFI
jgi:Xaa-Pro dipeptidase